MERERERKNEGGRVGKIERGRETDRQTDRQAQGREGEEVELGAREIYILSDKRNATAKKLFY